MVARLRRMTQVVRSFRKIESNDVLASGQDHAPHFPTPPSSKKQAFKKQ